MGFSIDEGPKARSPLIGEDCITPMYYGRNQYELGVNSGQYKPHRVGKEVSIDEALKASAP